MKTELETLLTAIEQRAEKATEGPWVFVEDEMVPHLRAGNGNFVRGPIDFRFIAAARSDVPALVKCIRHLASYINILTTSQRHHESSATVLSEAADRLKGEKP